MFKINNTFQDKNVFNIKSFIDKREWSIRNVDNAYAYVEVYIVFRNPYSIQDYQILFK